MATITDLIRRANKLMDDTADTIDLVDWFNQCQDELSNILYLPTKATLTKNADGYFELPSDFNGELKVIADTVYIYEVYDNCIHFDGEEDATELNISYNRLPAKITNTADLVPDIPERFHALYVFYACKMYMAMDDESDRKAIFDSEYANMRRQLMKFMSKQRPKPERWEVVR